jgi:L-lysine 6-transaminase
VIDLEKSHGAVIVDVLEGKAYLDCYGYFATPPVGHSHPKLKDEGFRESLMTAALSNPSDSDMYSREFAAFVKSFRDLAVPVEFRYLFFVAGGADKVLHFRDASHGRTGYTLSVTNTDPTKTDDFPQFDWPRISSPPIDFPIDEEAVTAKEKVACAEIQSAFEDGPDGIAAILIEPIQAEGSGHHFRPEFFARLREYADRYESLLIFDEVQTGLDSTGTMWAYEQSGVVPDLISFGKKTQVCDVMSTRRIDEIESNVFHVSGRINSTWGGISPTWSVVSDTWKSSMRTAS